MAVDSGPSRKAVTITPSDSNSISPPRGLWVGTAGNLTVTMPETSSADVVFKNIPSGTLLPICPSFVKAATTAADIVALY